MKSRKRKVTILIVIIILTMIVLFIITFTSCNKITPINLKQEHIHSISISVESRTPYISGSAKIKEYDKIKDTVQIINSLNAVTVVKDYKKELSGDSPSVMIHIYDEKGNEIDFIYFYDNLLRYNQKYYKIRISQYDKLTEICSKYGECRLSPLGNDD